MCRIIPTCVGGRIYPPKYFHPTLIMACADMPWPVIPSTLLLLHAPPPPSPPSPPLPHPPLSPPPPPPAASLDGTLKLWDTSEEGGGPKSFFDKPSNEWKKILKEMATFVGNQDGVKEGRLSKDMTNIVSGGRQTVFGLSCVHMHLGVHAFEITCINLHACV